jgi:hypothetical protein
VNKNRLATVALAAVLALTLTPLQAGAQTYLGLKGGLNLADIYGTDSEGLDSRTGLAGGALVMFQLSPTFAIQPEFLYTMKGAKGSEGGLSLKLKMSYLEVPFLLKFLPPVNSATHPSVYIGPAVAFSLNSTAEAEALGVSGSVDIANTKSVDVGLVFGADVEIPAGAKGLVLLDVRYTLGLAKAFDDTDPYDINNPPTPLPLADPTTGTAFDVKNSALTFTVGYAFPLGSQ